jgi:hypothetical protein
MNEHDFDRLSRRIGAASSRRGLLHAFFAGAAAVAAGAVLDRVPAHATQLCGDDDGCPDAQRCLSGVCVADSDPSALNRVYTGGPQSSRMCGPIPPGGPPGLNPWVYCHAPP